MLLTLNAHCLRSLLLASPKGRRQAMSVFDLPAFTKQTLGLNGLNLSTDMLVGFNRAARNPARAGRQGRVLLPAVGGIRGSTLTDPESAEAAIARMHRVITAANILGCNSAAMHIKAPDSDQVMDIVSKR